MPDLKGMFWNYKECEYRGPQYQPFQFAYLDYLSLHEKEASGSLSLKLSPYCIGELKSKLWVPGSQ